MDEINMKERFKKGQPVAAVGALGWFGIVVTAPRGKKSEIIECVEVFGFGHENGSAYVHEYKPITKEMFGLMKEASKWKNESLYFKGKILD